MKKLACILGASVALSATVFAQTAADVMETDTLNNDAEIVVTETEVKATQVASDEVQIDESIVVSEIVPNRGETEATPVSVLVGRWLGVVPCADCPGVELDLIVEADGSFSLTETYKASKDGVNTSTGTAVIDPETGALSLQLSNGETRVMSLQQEQLIYIDAEGNIQAEYMLQKEKADK